MKTLIIDTATEKGVAALYQGDRLCEELLLPEGQQSSTFLMPALSDLFSRRNLQVSDLSLIGVGVGPGSHTGVRVGVSIAQAFSFACGIPLVGLNSLKGFVYEPPGPFISVIDARSCGFYALRGERVNGIVSFIGQPALVSLEELLKFDGMIVTPKGEALLRKCSNLPVREVPISHGQLFEEAKSLHSQGVFFSAITYQDCFLQPSCC